MTRGDRDIPVGLTVAGTDPSGGAGINVDLQVFRDFGLHGTSVISAVVWQNSRGVDGWRALERAELRAQLDAVVDDFELDAVKIGMLPTRELIDETARFLEQIAGETPVVLDPVMVSGSGEADLTTERARAGFDALAESVDLITPNGPEARALTGADDPGTDPVELVERLLGCGWRRVLLKGGHLDGEVAGEVVDWYGVAGGVEELAPLPAVEADVRGTGCQLSTALACARGRSAPWSEAVDQARAYLNEMLAERARSPGRGRPMVVRRERN